MATDRLAKYLTGLIADRRGRPGDDLLTALIHAEDEGEQLSDDDIIATALLLLIAGHETTANLIGNALLALRRFPDQAARLRDDDAVAKPAVDEFLRFDPPAQIVERIALDDVEVQGRLIEKGTIVIVGVGAANRDPAVFARPNQLDVGRSPNPHLGFGAGAHFCLGAPLARVEARIVLPALLRRFPRLEVVGRPPLRDSFTIRGRRAVELHLGRAA